MTRRHRNSRRNSLPYGNEDDDDEPRFRQPPARTERQSRSRRHEQIWGRVSDSGRAEDTEEREEPRARPSRGREKRRRSPDRPPPIVTAAATAAPPAASSPPRDEEEDNEWVQLLDETMAASGIRYASPTEAAHMATAPVAYDLSATMSQIMQNVQKTHSDVAISTAAPAAVDVHASSSSSPHVRWEDEEEGGDLEVSPMHAPLPTGPRSGASIPSDPVDISPYFAPVTMKITIKDSIQQDPSKGNCGNYALLSALRNIDKLNQRKFFGDDFTDAQLADIHNAEGQYAHKEHIEQLYDAFLSKFFARRDVVPDLRHLGIYILDGNSEYQFLQDYTLAPGAEDLRLNSILIVAVAHMVFFEKNGTSYVEGSCVGYRFPQSRGGTSISKVDVKNNDVRYTTEKKLIRHSLLTRGQGASVDPVFNSKARAVFIVNTFVTQDPGTMAGSTGGHWIMVVLTTGDVFTDWEWEVYDSLSEFERVTEEQDKILRYARIIEVVTAVIVGSAVFSPGLASLQDNVRNSTFGLGPLLYTRFMETHGILGQHLIPRQGARKSGTRAYVDRTQYESPLVVAAGPGPALPTSPTTSSPGGTGVGTASGTASAASTLRARPRDPSRTPTVTPTTSTFTGAYFPPTGSFTHTSAHATARSIYADKGAWLRQARVCVRCDLPYIEAASNGRLQCWAHANPIPPPLDPVIHRHKRARVYECCERPFTGDLTPEMIMQNYTRSRDAHIATFMKGSIDKPNIPQILTMATIQGDQVQMGCVPVDHCTAEQVDMCREQGTKGFLVQYTKDDIARVWGGPKEVKTFLERVPAAEPKTLTSEVYTVFKTVIPPAM